MSVVDPNVARVKVVDEFGKFVWRKPDEVKPSDQIMFHPTTGLPITMNNEPGRKNNNNKTTTSSPTNISSTPVPTIQQAQIAMSSTQLNIANQQMNKISTLMSDKILGNVLNNIESGDVLNSVIEGLAEESASLKFERTEAERKGENTSQLSIRRVNALKAVGDAWIKKKEMLSNQTIDLDGKAFKILFGFLAETFRRACDEAKVRPEMTESIFANFGKMIDADEWLKEAKARMEKG
jgi:hypothetical protein